MSRRLGLSLSVVVALVMVIGINLFAQSRLDQYRADLTEQDLFTLSGGTCNILRSLDDPVTIRFYVSRDIIRDIPSLKSYADRVGDLLGEYQRVGGDHFNVVKLDPEPFSEVEDEAVARGLQGVPVGTGDEVLYFGAVVSGPTDDEVAIPFFSLERERFLEYDLTRLVYQVTHPEKKRIGLLTSLDMHGVGSHASKRTPQPWAITEQIRQLFELVDIEAGTQRIPDDIDVLMIAHPHSIDDAALYAVDQYALGGGRILAFVDPMSETDAAIRAANLGESRASDLGPLLKAWGIDYDSGQIAIDRDLAQTVRFNRPGSTRATEYPVWMRLTRKQFNPDDIITANLDGVTIASAGFLKPVPGSSIEFQPLLRTTTDASVIDAETIAFVFDPENLLRSYQPTGEKLTVAARVTGRASTAFPDPRSANTAGNKPNHLTSGQINAVVFADSDLLQDRFWVRRQMLMGNPIYLPTAANANLVINALENLVGSEDLISVRNRGQYRRPFTRVTELRRQAEDRYRETEQMLQIKLRDTNNKLAELQKKDTETGQKFIDQDTAQTIERFRNDIVSTRKELRHVRRQLRENIDTMQSRIKAINILVVPGFIGLVGIAASLIRRRRRDKLTLNSL